MAHRFLISAIFLFFALPSSGARPQLPLVQTAIPPPQAQLPRTEPQTDVPQAIVLPKIVVAGEKATLAVVDGAGRLVPAVDIELSSGAKVSTDDTGRATFLAPAQAGILTARITETAQDFTTTVLVIPKDTRNSRADAPVTASSSRLIFPRLIALQDRFDLLGGGFSGEAYLDSVVLGNLPAFVLAASPVSLVAQPNPRIGPGQTELAAGLAGARLADAPVTVISLQVLGPEKPLSPGEANDLTVRVNGSSERLMLQVRTLTPEVVNFSRGDAEYLLTSGGPMNAAKIKVRGVKAGNYSLSARLAAVGAPNIEIARLQLLAARQLANVQWQKALDRLMLRMERARDNVKEADAQHAAHFRPQIERLLRNHPQEPMAGLLRLAWQFLGWDAD